MGGTHPALEWLARRRDGESAALIAWRAGVSPQLVKRATDGYGPFPRASRHLGRTHASAAQMHQQGVRWVQARRRGQSVAQIADREGVSHQYVSRLTVEQGPYPDVEVVHEWVTARRDGRSVVDIAATEDVPEATVRRATRPHGPFPVADRRRLPDGVVGVNAIAELTGMSHPAVSRWLRRGRVPEADFVTGRGRRLWLESTIARWLAGSGMHTCPECGARCVSVAQHRAGKHRAAAAGGR